MSWVKNEWKWVEWKWASVSERIERDELNEFERDELNEFERNEWVLRNEWTIRATLWGELEIEVR